MNDTIEIHEFSTGINFEILADGTWVSKGFIGAYMNSTLEQIPRTVERAIANKYFAVAEGKSSDSPAIIGRVIPSQDNYPDYSVIALVTCGRDEYSRPVSLYRYFLCEGRYSLEVIILYIIQLYKNGRLPIFNPTEKRKIGNPINYRLNEVFRKSPPPYWLNTSGDTHPLPILIPPSESVDVEKIHSWAIEVAGDQPVAWAYNVKAVEDIWGFTLIHSASERDYEDMQRILANPPVVARLANFDEQALKSAIKSLMNNSQPKAEAVREIAKALNNEEITPEYWAKLFTAEGADSAIKDGIYSEQMSRLLALRALILPKTLLQFCDWLIVSRNSHLIKDCQQWQKDFKRIFVAYSSTEEVDRFQYNLIEGIKIIITQLIGKEINPADATDFLTKAAVIHKDILPEIVEHDLELIGKNSKNHDRNELKGGYEIWRDLIKYKSHQTKYKPLYQLFESLKQDKLAAYFYQVSIGKLPKDKFQKAFQLKQGYSINYCGREISRKASLSEKIITWLTQNIQTILFSIVAILLLIGSAVIGYKVGYNTPRIPTSETFARAVTNFDKTQDAIKSLVGDGKNKDENFDKIIEILDNNKLSKEVILKPKNTKDEEKQQEEWVKAIYKYQQNQADGIIRKDNESFKKLREELTRE